VARRVERAPLLLGPHRQRAVIPPATGAARSALNPARDPAQALFAALAEEAQGERVAGCLASLGAFDPRALDFASQTAFWLNTYNACVLRDVTGLVRLTERFFDSARIVIAGHAWSLDDIEHGLLRGAPKYGRLRAPIAPGDPRLRFAPPAYDERVHFGMYTACRSSPPLQALDGARLEEQLEAAARDYLVRTVSIARDGSRVRLPKLFQWYADDFGGRSGVLEFVLARIDDEALIGAIDRRHGQVELEYQDYDWTLEATSSAPASAGRRR
jgi:hypothetical protein